MNACFRSNRTITTLTFVILGTSIAVAGCAPRSPVAPTASHDVDAPASRTNKAPVKLDVKHLPNAYRIHEKIVSGGLPEGESAFVELAQLGIQTIVSVDGAKPDVELARKHGLRYVHLPHGYDGITAERVEQLAKAVRDLPGPIYIHCHHGKHRSPAAAAAACVSVGFLSNREALDVLRTAGTSEHYQGLYRTVEVARRLDDQRLDQLPADFPETAAVGPMAQAMVEIERRYGHLKAIAKAGWKAPAEHPALVPAHEALLLREHFTELQRAAKAPPRAASFQRMLRESEQAAKELEAALRTTPWTTAAARSATNSLDRITSSCAACHQEHRDRPIAGRTDKKMSDRNMGTPSSTVLPYSFFCPTFFCR